MITRNWIKKNFENYIDTALASTIEHEQEQNRLQNTNQSILEIEVIVKC